MSHQQKNFTKIVTVILQKSLRQQGSGWIGKVQMNGHVNRQIQNISMSKHKCKKGEIRNKKGLKENGEIPR